MSAPIFLQALSKLGNHSRVYHCRLAHCNKLGLTGLQEKWTTNEYDAFTHICNTRHLNLNPIFKKKIHTHFINNSEHYFGEINHSHQKQFHTTVFVKCTNEGYNSEPDSEERIEKGKKNVKKKTIRISRSVETTDLDRFMKQLADFLDKGHDVQIFVYKKKARTEAVTKRDIVSIVEKKVQDICRPRNIAYTKSLYEEGANMAKFVVKP